MSISILDLPSCEYFLTDPTKLALGHGSIHDAKCLVSPYSLLETDIAITPTENILAELYHGNTKPSLVLCFDPASASKLTMGVLCLTMKLPTYPIVMSDNLTRQLERTARRQPAPMQSVNDAYLTAQIQDLVSRLDAITNEYQASQSQIADLSLKVLHARKELAGCKVDASIARDETRQVMKKLEDATESLNTKLLVHAQKSEHDAHDLKKASEINIALQQKITMLEHSISTLSKSTGQLAKSKMRISDLELELLHSECRLVHFGLI